METEPCGPDDTFWKRHATGTVRRPGLLWEGTPLCVTWTPARGHACSLALPLVLFGLWTLRSTWSLPLSRERMRMVDVTPHPTGPAGAVRV